MKAFLSHSSKDKGFIDSIASNLRPGTYELDSESFDAGLINSQAIAASLRRCDLFCLLLSTNSATSAYVDFETLLGLEFFASGKIKKFLVICLDEASFEKASANVKFFNIVRKISDADVAARLIQGYLISASGDESHRPFLGRDEEILELEKQASDHGRPNSKGVFISGNFGSGRRTLAHKFYERRYPQVGRNFPSIDLDSFVGTEELYRKVLAALRPTMTTNELKTRIQAFSIAAKSEKVRLIAQLFDSLLAARETAVLLDTGGMLLDSGQFVPEINDVIGQLGDKPHPPIVFIAPRMIPRPMRRPENDISYTSVKSLKRDESKRLIGSLLKDQQINVSDANLTELMKLGDGHPYNIYRMVDEVVERGAESFLANPSEFIDWKHRQSSAYVAKVSFSDSETQILALLKQLPQLDFAAIIASLELDPADTSEELLRLKNLHVIESRADVFALSPALRVAIERDRRFRMSESNQRTAMKRLASALVVRLEDGTAAISLIDAAILASLESGEGRSEFTSVFLLPSHAVWLARRNYDQQHWMDCIFYATEALKGAERLSSQGFVAACRFLCLAAARVGDSNVFDTGIKRLRSVAADAWARSNIAFLYGFHSRMLGNLPKAETFFRESYELSPGNISAAREIAAICLARDNLDEAETFAREAISHAPTNAFLLDIMIAVLIRKHGRSSKYSSEINSMFDTLEAVDKEGNRSFFLTRKAEFEHLWGDNRIALRFVEEAISRTPTIFEPHRLHVEILLKDGNKAKAREILQKMNERVNSRDPNERRTNYRQYLKTYAHYLEEVGQFDDAKAVYDDLGVFTEAERDAAKKAIEIAQGYRLARS